MKFCGLQGEAQRFDQGYSESMHDSNTWSWLWSLPAYKQLSITNGFVHQIKIQSHFFKYLSAARFLIYTSLRSLDIYLTLTIEQAMPFQVSRLWTIMVLSLHPVWSWPQHNTFGQVWMPLDNGAIPAALRHTRRSWGNPEVSLPFLEISRMQMTCSTALSLLVLTNRILCGVIHANKVNRKPESQR